MRRARLLALALALAAGACLHPAAAEEAPAATLIADRVEIRADAVLVAEGNVEVFYRGARLRAARISYDRRSDRITVEGPIVLTQGEGVAVFADFAELSADLRNGLLVSARLVLERELQLAAAEIFRAGGRYTELSTVVASSCQVCAARLTPLWEIRARRVVHDAEARQIWFEGAQFRLGGLPVAYIPRLRIPDPGNRRAAGLLFPTFRTTSELGAGVKLPYFLPVGRSADLTLTPYLSPATRTLGLRWRQAFRRGAVELEGAVTRDDLRPDETRGYLFGQGAFLLPAGYRLRFQLREVSDPAYLLDYGHSAADRLESHVILDRTRRDLSFEASAWAFRSLRPGEDSATQPGLVTELAFTRRFAPQGIGGIATLSFGALTVYRTAAADGTGRDVARASARAAWTRTELFGPGLLAAIDLAATAESYAVTQDSAFPGGVARLYPEAGVTLRWPLMRRGAGGARQLLEPFAMLAWAPEDPEAIPNEDSRLVEFDEGNLLSLTRFPGRDARERGTRLALGLGWSRHDPAGWTAGLTLGRILRDTDRGDFGPGTGLDGARSDWLLAARLDLPPGFGLAGRALIGDDLGVTRADIGLSLASGRLDLATGLTLLDAAPDEDRPEPIAEWTLDADWRINRNWVVRSGWRYDFEVDRATRAGLGLGFVNECLTVDLSLSRRFTSSTSLRATTDFGLGVALTGFGTGGEGGAPRRRCGR
jgi:LPS-assembly protein